MIIGVDLGGTKITAGLVDRGKIIKKITEPINPFASRDDVVRHILRVISRVFDSRVKGIGIGVPALVDSKGILYESVNIRSFEKVDLKKIVSKKFEVRTEVNNDANCFALGEKKFGHARKCPDAVGLIIGTGVGAGIILNNRLHSGANYAAGEFGKIPYLDYDIEYYCSGKFFMFEHGKRGEELFEKALRRDKKAKKVFKEYGIHLGRLISIVANSVDPSMIVLGGSVSKSYKFFSNSMKESMKKSMYSRVYKNIKIKVSENTENMAILGAASLL